MKASQYLAGGHNNNAESSIKMCSVSLTGLHIHYLETSFIKKHFLITIVIITHIYFILKNPLGSPRRQVLSLSLFYKRKLRCGTAGFVPVRSEGRTEGLGVFSYLLHTRPPNLGGRWERRGRRGKTRKEMRKKKKE